MLPPAPPGFEADAFFRQTSYWHQRWELFPGIFVPGRNDVALICDAAQLPRRLDGLRVLDVGALNGCFSFECERRGAAEVVALSLEDPERSGFNRLKQILGSRVTYVTGSAYSLAPRQLGTFDVILFLGVLYHLRYPLLAIDRLRSVSRGDVLIETHVIDHRSWLRGPLGFLARLVRGTPVWRQYREFELHREDQSNWFGPNIVAVLEAFQSAGFSIAHTRSWRDRATFRAKAGPLPERLLKHSYESFAANADLVGLNTPDQAVR